MNENQVNQSNLLDATDCLEAIGVFRGWKNFLFVVMILALLLTQTSFWLVNTGYIPADEQEVKSDTGVSTEKIVEKSTNEEQAQPIKSLLSQSATESNEPNKASADTSAKMPTEEVESQEDKKPLFGTTFERLSGLLDFVNAVLILAAVLYCLTMLFSLKISLLGRLGGINHICRAFFLSLVMLILLLPWQTVFGHIVLGEIYTPGELVKWLDNKTSGFETVLFYLRFTGYWLLILLLLFLSQLRSSRWARAILRRLEII